MKKGVSGVYFESEIAEIKPKSVRIQTPKGPEELENDFVLAMTGYQPNFSLLESLGVEFHQDEFNTPIYDQNTMESSQKEST